VKFPFPSKKDLLLVIINNGECYMLETQSEKFLEFNLNHIEPKIIIEKEMEFNEDSGSDVASDIAISHCSKETDNTNLATEHYEI
jgi:hypothetical protein